MAFYENFNSKFDYIICAYAIKKYCQKNEIEDHEKIKTKFKFFLGEELKQMNDQKPNIITEKCSLLNDFELTFWRICMRSSSYSLRFRFLASENRNFGSKGHIDGCNDTINVFFLLNTCIRCVGRRTWINMIAPSISLKSLRFGWLFRLV